MIKHDPGATALKGWHLDKRISVAHILTTVSFVVGLGSVIWALESRVTLTEQNLKKDREVNEVHREVDRVEHDSIVAQVEAVKMRDIQLMNEWVRQNNEILRRLERIEDGVNGHIAASAGKN